MIGGSGPTYKWAVSDNKTGSCTFTTNMSTGVFYDVNFTTGTTVCSQFLFNNTADAVRIDIALVIPSDSKTGALSDTITATATAM